MNITLTELIDMINKKTLLRLNKAMICHYECTKNKKIRITYQNGVVECYGCTIDCLETLNAKYNLRLTLNKEHAVLFDNRRQSNKDADPIFQQKNNPLIDEIINVLKELFNKIEKSKKSVYVNITEIKKTVNSMKKNILLCNPNELNRALTQLHSDEYSMDDEMSIYFKTIKKEIHSFG